MFLLRGCEMTEWMQTTKQTRKTKMEIAKMYDVRWPHSMALVFEIRWCCWSKNNHLHWGGAYQIWFTTNETTCATRRTIRPENERTKANAASTQPKVHTMERFFVSHRLFIALTHVCNKRVGCVSVRIFRGVNWDGSLARTNLSNMIVPKNIVRMKWPWAGGKSKDNSSNNGVSQTHIKNTTPASSPQVLNCHCPRLCPHGRSPWSKKLSGRVPAFVRGRSRGCLGAMMPVPGNGLADAHRNCRCSCHTKKHLGHMGHVVGFGLLVFPRLPAALTSNLRWSHPLLTY